MRNWSRIDRRILSAQYFSEITLMTNNRERINKMNNKPVFASCGELIGYNSDIAIGNVFAC